MLQVEGSRSAKFPTSFRRRPAPAPGAGLRRPPSHAPLPVRRSGLDHATQLGGRALRSAATKAQTEAAAAFIASAVTPRYDDLARNPNQYSGKALRFRGEVVQVVGSSTRPTLRVNVT